MRGRALVTYGCATHAEWLRAALSRGDGDALRRVRLAMTPGQKDPLEDRR